MLTQAPLRKLILAACGAVCLAVAVTACGADNEQLDAPPPAGVGTTSVSTGADDVTTPASREAPNVPATTDSVVSPNPPVAESSVATPSAEAVDTVALERFVTAYENHPLWGTFDPVLGPLTTWRERVASYVVVGEIVGPRVETRPYQASMVVPCTSAAPDEDCELPAFDVVRLVVDLKPNDAPYLLPEGERQRLQPPSDLVSIEIAIGFVEVKDQATAAAAASDIARPLIDTVPVGATMQSVVWVQEDGPDRRPTHFGMLATLWALVDVDGSLVQARRSEWPADSGLLPYATISDSLAAVTTFVP